MSNTPASAFKVVLPGAQLLPSSFPRMLSQKEVEILREDLGAAIDWLAINSADYPGRLGAPAQRALPVKSDGQ